VCNPTSVSATDLPVDVKPPANCSAEPTEDLGNPSSLELDDVKPDIKSCIGIPTTTKAPIAKKG